MQGQALRSDSQAPQTQSVRIPVRLLIVPACFIVFLCCAATGPVASQPGVKQKRLGSFLTAPVMRGRLEDVLAQRGTVEAVENFVVASECEWTQRILRLVPEGEWVERGDVVVVLDSSELEERLQQREILIINAAASLENARQALRLQELTNQSLIARAELAAMLAELDRERYHEGEFPKLLREAQAKVAMASEDLKRAEDRYEYVTRKARKGYESYTKLESERISLLKYENALSVARRELSVLEKYTGPRQFTELEALAENTKLELARIRDQAKLSLGNQQVLVQNRERQYQRHVEYADRLRRSIEACKIRAPKTGEIIYANEGSMRNEILEGKFVRYRQEVVRIPNLEALQVDVRIHESQINGVREGLEAVVSVDALPGVVYRGLVTSVSRVPTAGSYYTRDLKEYDASIRIEAHPDDTRDLRPGMSAKVDIDINHRDDCLYVPPQSIVNVAGHSMVFVSTADGIEHREVRTGMAADTGIEVISGLHAGEKVLLSPRTTCSDEIIALTKQFESETRVASIGG